MGVPHGVTKLSILILRKKIRTFILPELVRYQSIMCDFVSQFSFSAWLNYDRMFRFRMAQNESLS